MQSGTLEVFSYAPTSTRQFLLHSMLSQGGLVQSFFCGRIPSCCQPAGEGITPFTSAIQCNDPVCCV